MAYDLSKVVVTSSPHIKADDDTRSLMLDVLIALVPALAVAVYTFGARALIHVVIAMVASLVFETIYNKNRSSPEHRRRPVLPGYGRTYRIQHSGCSSAVAERFRCPVRHHRC